MLQATHSLSSLFTHPIDTLREYCSPAWKKKFNYKREPKILDVGWGKVNTIGSIIIPIDALYARIWIIDSLKIKPLEKTPHYRWIKDILEHKDDSLSRAAYYEYSKTFFPEEDPDLQLVNIKKMALAFKEQNDIHTAPIMTFPPFRMEDGSYHVVLCDGVHRSCIAKILGKKFITCRIIEKENIRYTDFI